MCWYPAAVMRVLVTLHPSSVPGRSPGLMRTVLGEWREQCSGTGSVAIHLQEARYEVLRNMLDNILMSATAGHPLPVHAVRTSSRRHEELAEALEHAGNADSGAQQPSISESTPSLEAGPLMELTGTLSDGGGRDQGLVVHAPASSLRGDAGPPATAAVIVRSPGPRGRRGRDRGHATKIRRV